MEAGPRTTQAWNCTRRLYLEERSKRSGLALRVFLDGESVRSDQPEFRQRIPVPTGKIEDSNHRVDRRQRNLKVEYRQTSG